jgi:hypothetical protein
MAKKTGPERELTQADVDKMREPGVENPDPASPLKPQDEKPRDKVSLMRVTVRMAGRTYDEDLAAQAFVAPNIAALNEALATNTSRYSEWAMLEALAKGEVADIDGKIARLDSDIKEVEAQSYLDIVNAVLPGGKAPTVDAIKAAVTLDARRIALVRPKQELEVARLTAQDNQNKVAVGRRTLEEKKDILLELSRNWRQEMQTQLTTNAERFKPGGR